VAWLAWDYDTQGGDLFFGVVFHPLQERQDGGVEMSGMVQGDMSLEGEVHQVDCDDAVLVEEEMEKAPEESSQKDHDSVKSEKGLEEIVSNKGSDTSSLSSAKAAMSAGSGISKSKEEGLSISDRLAAAVARPNSISSSTATNPSPSIPQISSSPKTSDGIPQSLVQRSKSRITSLPIIPLTKVKTTPGSTMSGIELISGRRGVYSFLWDNSHSVVLQKNIRFNVGIVTCSFEEV
jgi:hypothetical protein